NCDAKYNYQLCASLLAAIDSRPSAKNQLLQRLSEGSCGDASFRDNGGNVLGRGHVKGRIFNRHAVRDHLAPGDVGDLLRVALLDGNAVAIGSRQIDGGDGRSHIERDSVFFGEY